MFSESINKPSEHCNVFSKHCNVPAESCEQLAECCMFFTKYTNILKRGWMLVVKVFNFLKKGCMPFSECCTISKIVNNFILKHSVYVNKF